MEKVGGRLGQEGVVGDGRIGAGEDAGDGGVDRPRRLEPADRLVEGQREEAGLGIGGERPRRRRRHLDPAVDEARLVGVDLGRHGKEPRLGDLLRGVEHLADRGAVIGGEARMPQRVALDLQHLVEHEVQIAAVDDHRHEIFLRFPAFARPGMP